MACNDFDCQARVPSCLGIRVGIMLAANSRWLIGQDSSGMSDTLDEMHTTRVDSRGLNLLIDRVNSQTRLLSQVRWKDLNDSGVSPAVRYLECHTKEN